MALETNKELSESLQGWRRKSFQRRTEADDFQRQEDIGQVTMTPQKNVEILESFCLSASVLLNKMVSIIITGL